MSVRYMSCVDLHLILRRGDQILLGQRINTGFGDGSYDLPAGHLEDGESATDGLVREAAEEIGVHIDPTDLACVHIMHHYTNSGRIALFFEATVWSGEIVNAEPSKSTGWDWHSLDSYQSHSFTTSPKRWPTSPEAPSTPSAGGGWINWKMDL